jgi:ABC-type Fe3+-siderophore transport system permease subunit
MIKNLSCGAVLAKDFEMSTAKKVPRWLQQLGGSIIVAVGLGFTLWNWKLALTDGQYYIKVSFIFPAFVVVGIGLIFFPDYKTERLARGEDISNLQGLALLTTRWKVILALACLAGFTNFGFISLH